MKMVLGFILVGLIGSFGCDDKPRPTYRVRTPDEIERDYRASVAEKEKRQKDYEEWYAVHMPDPEPIKMGDLVHIGDGHNSQWHTPDWEVIGVNGDWITVTLAPAKYDSGPVSHQIYNRRELAKPWVEMPKSKEISK